VENPRFLSVTLTTANTNYNLLTLLQAVDTEFNDSPYQRCRRLAIQADFDAGAARFFVGNTDMTGSIFGVEIVATQSVLYEDEQDTIILNHVFLRCDTDSQPMHVTVQFR